MLNIKQKLSWMISGAAILALALERMGHKDWSLYDGSWAEWGMFPTVPVATGDA